VSQPPLDPDRELAARVASPKRIAYDARDSILKLLSEAELAQVSTAEEAATLAAGDEYLDLEHLEHGVRKAPVMAAEASRMLPRSAVREETWRKILAVLRAMGEV